MILRGKKKIEIRINPGIIFWSFTGSICVPVTNKIHRFGHQVGTKVNGVS